MLPLVCPHCRHKFDLEQACQEVDGRKFIELVTSLPPSLIRPLFNYCRLFTPEKQAMTWTKALKIVKELTPMIKDGQVNRNKVTYDVPIQVWLAAFSYLTETPPTSLTLPLKGNGYLLSVLVAQAEKTKVLEAEQKEAAKQAEKAAGERLIEAAKQKVAEREQPPVQKPAPIPPEWAAQVRGMLVAASNAPPLTADQKAEHITRLEQRTPEQIERLKQQQLADIKAQMSPEEREKYEVERLKNLEEMKKFEQNMFSDSPL
jgi:hypothetical protein